MNSRDPMMIECTAVLNRHQEVSAGADQRMDAVDRPHGSPFQVHRSELGLPGWFTGFPGWFTRIHPGHPGHPG